MARPYQICTRTVMDTSDPDITFDADGVCHYWHAYMKEKARRDAERGTREERLDRLVKEIREAGKGKPYDCLIGVSGGIDSSFVAMKCLDLGLRPLAVHYDGGWDSKIGAHNLAVITEGAKLDRIDVRVADDEIRDLMRAYLSASVIDIGVYADHAILATMYNSAYKHKIRHVLIGANFETEFINPPGWVYRKTDVVNLNAIHGRFGQLPELKTYPKCGFLKFTWLTQVAGLRFLNLIDYFDFDQKAVEDELTRRFGWQPYPRKHGEVVFTKFYQQYILPRKFGVDKRRMHYSSLICSGQMTRVEALELMQQPIYDPGELAADMKEVLAKLQLSKSEFDDLMAVPPRRHDEFPSDVWQRELYKRIVWGTSHLRRGLGLRRAT